MNTRQMPTLGEAFAEYLKGRPDLRQGSKFAYENAFKRIDQDIASKPLNEIKFSQLKTMYLRMRYEQDLQPASIELLNNVINPVFIWAMEDELIEKNPNQGALHAAAKGDAWHKTRRPALSPEDQREFMSYVHESDLYRRWENFFIFLFGTGCRIGETIGIRWEDISFEKGTININHSVSYIKGEFVFGPPKSSSGRRIIPMIPEVRTALEKENQLAILTQIVKEDNIPGKTGCIFRSHRGTMIHPSMVNNTIKAIVKEHNEKNPAHELPDFSVHQTRHSFATRLCEQDVNIKVIQSVMGHSDIGMTMDIYAEVSEAKLRQEIGALAGIVCNPK